MKQKIGFITILGALCFSVSGCKGDTDDINKQVSKMNNIIEQGDIFSKDYRIEGEISSKYGNNENSIEYLLKKDGSTYYVELESEFNDKENTIRYWLEKENSSYYVYYDDGIDKLYLEINENDKVNDILGDIFTDAGVSINPDLKTAYENIKSNIESSIDSCNENSIEGLTCKVDKTLFGKVTFNMNYSLKGTNSSSSFVLKKGKVMEVSSLYTSDNSYVSSEVEFDYGNQKISLPNKDEYVKSN